jgi:hypothetical protein
MLHTIVSMINRQPSLPFDEGKLLLLRQFLYREFRECRHDDFFAADERSHVFVMESPRSVTHTLVVPAITFADPGFARLCNAELAETLKRAGERHILLTPRGPVVVG